MNRLIFIVILGSLMAKSYAAPLDSQTAADFEEDHELIGGFFQGDMNIEMTRNGKIAESSRWPNGTVPYKIDDVFDLKHYKYIRVAMRIIEKVSCIRFVPPMFHNAKAYLHFKGEPSGCHAEVGYHGKPQSLNLQVDPLNEGCFKLGTILHEILHSLGFHHQHSATNRDEYILIVEENIMDNKLGNFIKYDSNTITDFGVEYDYSSIMHYNAYAYSKNGQKTIIPLQGEHIEIGQREALSSGDINKLNLMYNCPPNAITTPKPT